MGWQQIARSRSTDVQARLICSGSLSISVSVRSCGTCLGPASVATCHGLGVPSDNAQLAHPPRSSRAEGVQDAPSAHSSHCATALTCCAAGGLSRRPVAKLQPSFPVLCLSCDTVQFCGPAHTCAAHTERSYRAGQHTVHTGPAYCSFTGTGRYTV